MFIKIKMKDKVGKSANVLVAVEHIGTIIEGKNGAQILLKNTDVIPSSDSFEEVERKIKVAMGGTGNTIMV